MYYLVLEKQCVSTIQHQRSNNMYKQTKNKDGSINTSQIQRVLDGTWIPFDPANSDYQQYLKWLEEGNTPLPAEENT